MAEINHKWVAMGALQVCKRCGANRRAISKTTFEWLIDNQWKKVREQPECDARPKSERT